MQAQSKIISSRPLTPSTHLITVERPAGFRFEAGQHVMIEIDTPSGKDDRFLSIASAPSDADLDFAVRLSDSDFKQAFQRLQPGDPVSLTGPAGRFKRNPERPAVLLSGGIGITPLRSMLRDAAHRGDLPPTVLLYGNRCPAEIPFGSELDARRDLSGVRILHTVDEADEGWQGAVGRIDGSLLEEAQKDLPQPALFYVCGPPGMVAAMSALLADLKIDRSHVLLEHFTGY